MNGVNIGGPYGWCCCCPCSSTSSIEPDDRQDDSTAQQYGSRSTVIQQPGSDTDGGECAWLLRGGHSGTNSLTHSYGYGCAAQQPVEQNLAARGAAIYGPLDAFGGNCMPVMQNQSGNEPEWVAVKASPNLRSSRMGYWINPSLTLAGFEDDELCHGTIVIQYNIPDGTQEFSLGHPNEESPYKGCTWNAYLPNNPSGREVLELFKISWCNGQTFEVERSACGEDYRVIWSNRDVIIHKTSLGSDENGYPDPDYLLTALNKLKRHFEGETPDTLGID